MEVFLSKLAESKLLALSDYLEEKWSSKIKNDFFKKLEKKVKMISTQPMSCPESNEFKGLFKCVVTKQSTFYYRIDLGKNEIEIITFFDSRQNPDLLMGELR